MKHISALSIIFTLLTYSSTGFAQTGTAISGTVRDADANEKMPGVTVKVDSSNGVITGGDGKYHVSVKPGEHQVTFSFIGYLSVTKTITIKVGEQRQLNAKLEVKNRELNTVVVTSSQYEKKLSQETISMDVLNKDMIQNTNSNDLGELLAKDPGITNMDGQISIRGGSSYSYGVGSRTAVMVDGQSYMSADLGDAQLNFAPIEDAEQVEVIKGASSVIYGSSALDGVVNMVTAWPKSETPKFDVSVYSGVYTDYPNKALEWWNQPAYIARNNPGAELGTTFINTNQGHGPRGDIGARGSYKQRIKNLQLVIGADVYGLASYLQENNDERLRLNFKTRYTLPKNPFIAFGVNGNLMLEKDGRFFIGKSMTPDSAYEVSSGDIDRYIRSQLNPHFTYLDDKGNRYKFTINYLNVWRYGGGTETNASSNEVSIDNQYQYKMKQGIILTVGTPVDFGLSVSNLYTGLQTDWSAAGYAQAEYDYKRLSLVAGLRYEAEKIDTTLEKGLPVFRSGINYRAGKATFLRASWGQGYRLPSIGERYVADNFTSDIYIVPNPELKTEESWNLELGVKQEFKIKNWSGFFDLATFFSQYRNYVEYSIGEYSNLYPGTQDTIFKGQPGEIFGLQPHNDQEARIFGFEPEFVTSGNIGNVKLTTLIGYTYVYAANLDSLSGDPTQKNLSTFFSNAFNYFDKHINPDSSNETKKVLLLRPRHIVRGDVEMDYKHLLLGGTLYYTSFPENFGSTIQFALEVLAGGYNSFQTYIATHIRGDWTGDVRIGYKFNDRFKVYAICKNVTNRFYMSRPGKVDPPRNLTLQLTMSF